MVGWCSMGTFNDPCWLKNKRSPRFRNDFSVIGKNWHGCCGDNMKMCDVNLHHLDPCKTDPSHPFTSNIRRPAAKVLRPWGMATVMLEHHVAFATSLTAKRFVSTNTSVSSCSLSMQATSSAERWRAGRPRWVKVVALLLFITYNLQ